jgi:hypothetical protein
MKMVILIPSEEYKNNAGARIRYGRLAPRLADHGISLTLENISDFDPRSAHCDVLVISKCHDARAVLAAEVLARRGALVGIDLFDDYFSQHADSRLARYRHWLGQILSRCDFAMCSTPVMRGVIGSFAPELAVHIVNDPGPDIDADRLRKALNAKLSAARSGGRIGLCWYGVGDNPNFAVGISDLADFAGAIRQLATAGPAVDLSILTNRRALDAQHLAMIAVLPATVSVAEWSEAAEAELLASSFACFLPVNAQGFSAAKSLNRAVTALAAGCQVLAVGYPLYAPFEGLIYSSAAQLLRDFNSASMRLSASSVDCLLEALDHAASPTREATSLASFIRDLPRRRTSSADLPPRLVHGVASNGAAHKMVQAVGGLSIGTPFSTTPLGFDVIFQARHGGRLAMLVSDKALSRMKFEMQNRAAAYGAVGDRNFWEIRDPSTAGSADEAWREPSLPLQLALYPSVMKEVLASLDAGFGPGPTIVSETSPLPFLAV